MRLRLGVHYEGLPGPNDYAGLVAHAREAERLGFESLWVGERPDPAAQGIPAALLVCAALAAATERVRIGTAVLPLPLYHPLRVAEDAATLDGLSEGRFDLGVGLGDDPAGHHGFGVPPEERASRLEEGLAILAQALGGSAVEFTGRHFQIAGVRVAPPAVQPGGPPIFLGAHAEVAVRPVPLEELVEARRAPLPDGIVPPAAVPLLCTDELLIDQHVEVMEGRAVPDPEDPHDVAEVASRSHE